MVLRASSGFTLGTKDAPKEEGIAQGAMLCVLPTNHEGRAFSVLAIASNGCIDTALA